VTPPSANPPYRLLRLAEARAAIAALPIRPVAPTRVAVGSSAGGWSADEVRSPADVPPRPTSAMDGFAIADGVRAGRLDFAVVEANGVRRLRPGEAVAVVTGETLPPGTSAVARVESVRLDHGTLRLRHSLPRGTDVHAPGSSIRGGARLVAKGQEVLPYTVAALLAAGVRRVRVRRPKAVVVATGTELRRPDDRSPGPRDALGPAIAALLRRWCDVTYAGVVPDDRAAIRSAVETAVRASDLVVTLGGSSVGPRDRTKAAVADAGRLVVGGTRINVLKRAGVGFVRGTPVLILPGQVESAFVSFHEHGLALLERLVDAPLRSYARRPLRDPITVAHRMDSTYLFREQDGHAIPIGWGVARYETLLGATGFAYLRHGRSYPRGHVVAMQRFERGAAIQPTPAEGSAKGQSAF